MSDIETFDEFVKRKKTGAPPKKKKPKKVPKEVWSKWTKEDINVQALCGVPTEKELKDKEEYKKKVYAERSIKLKKEETERQEERNKQQAKALKAKQGQEEKDSVERVKREKDSVERVKREKDSVERAKRDKERAIIQAEYQERIRVRNEKVEARRNYISADDLLRQEASKEYAHLWVVGGEGWINAAENARKEEELYQKSLKDGTGTIPKKRA